MNLITSTVKRTRSFVMSPGGMSVLEHTAYTLISMVTFAVLFSRFELETVGLWVLVMALLNYGQVADVWSKGLLSFIGEERGRGALSQAAEYASTTIVTGAAGYFLVISTGGVAVYIFAPSLFSPEQVGLVRHNLPLMVAAFSFIASAGNFRLAFVGFGFIGMSALQRSGGALFFLIGVLAQDPNSGLTGILIIQLLQGVAMVVFGVIVYYGFIARGMHHALWERAKFGQLFRFGSKLFFVASLEHALQPMLKILVSQIGGLGMVAVLEIVTRLIQGFLGLIVSVGQVLITSLARRHSIGQPTDTSALSEDFIQITKMLLGCALVVFSLLFAAGPLISMLFLDPEAQVRAKHSFQTMLWMLGIAWFINTASAAGYFLLMALRATRQLFFLVAIRVGLVALLGVPFGNTFGLPGLLVAVIIAFLLSSGFNLLMVSRSINLHFPKGLVDILRSEPSIFLPFAWANGLALLNVLLLNDAGQHLKLTAYSIGLVSTGLLVVQYGRLRFLIRAVMELDTDPHQRAA